jgi:hypothetical protein
MDRDFRTPFALGMLMTLVGAFTDAWWHLQGWAAREGFFTPAHATLYSGVGVMALSIFLLRRGTLWLSVSLSRTVRAILFIGISTMLAGGLFDFWWHSTYGFVDVVAWTPPHMTATAGFVILLVTTLAALSKNSRPIIKGAFALSVFIFVALWTAVILLTTP